MSDIKLFRLNGGKASELQGNASDLEKALALPVNTSDSLRRISTASHRLVRIQHAPRVESGMAPMLHAVRGELPRWPGLAFL